MHPLTFLEFSCRYINKILLQPTKEAFYVAVQILSLRKIFIWLKHQFFSLSCSVFENLNLASC